MKAPLSIAHANTENLTSLWKTASIPFQSHVETPHFDCCEVKGSDWPNRLWFKQVLNQRNIDRAKEKLLSTPLQLTVPYWIMDSDTSYKLLEANGFRVKFEQVAMCLKMEQNFSAAQDIVVKRIVHKADADVWTELYPKSFRYRISGDILARTRDSIHYYTAFYQGEPIGTAMLLQTEKIVGIHGVGVIPEMRRRGFAEQIMRHLLNIAMERGADFATLQASGMGKNIYVKLGFEEQFVIKNYVLP